MKKIYQNQCKVQFFLEWKINEKSALFFYARKSGNSVQSFDIFNPKWTPNFYLSYSWNISHFTSKTKEKYHVSSIYYVEYSFCLGLSHRTNTQIRKSFDEFRRWICGLFQGNRICWTNTTTSFSIYCMRCCVFILYFPLNN